MKVYLLLLITTLILLHPVVKGQDNSPWPPATQLVKIPSLADRSFQKAYFYTTQKNKPQPLIVSLHSWSGDYTQKDPLLPEVLLNDWNYIHPDFRGPNVRPEACGSELVIADIEQAIHYAIINGKVDTSEIHIIGSSGGGHATLMMYMNTDLNIKSFSAWVPISNLVDWYWSSKSRGLKYAKHILAATTSRDSVLNLEEAKKRSPYYQDTPVTLRKSSQLNIYCGIHDGYTGSVPISQSVLFFNKVVGETGGEEKDMISEHELNYMLSQRSYEALMSSRQYLGDRLIHYSKQYKHIRLTVFEGGHEMLEDVALGHILFRR